MGNQKITKGHCFTKYLFQCILVLLEFGGVSFLFTFLTSSIVPCDNIVDYLERGVLGLALYEFIIFVILEAINDGRKDSFAALQTAYCQAILACEEDSDVLYARVNWFIDQQLDPGRLNSVQVRDEYEALRAIMKQKNILELKYRLTNVEHQCNAADLRWRFTLLLRVFK